MGASYLVRNSTYDEVQQILAEGGTGSVWQINNYFEDRGIRAGYVRVRLAAWYPPYYRIGSKAGAGGTVFTPPLTRADWTPYRYWVAFETVDRGLIFIQPWSGREVKLETGQRYSELTGFPPPHYDDTIVEIIIVW